MDVTAPRHFHNPQSSPARRYGPAESAVLDRAGMAAARHDLEAWPGYAPTPLLDLAQAAHRLGVGRIWYKDEAHRFGLNSFKAMGAPYAVLRFLRGIIAKRGGAIDATVGDIAAGKYRDATRDVVVTSATDGNHGRAVAWGAEVLGCRAVIYIHEHVSPGREQAIARYGAEVRRVKGNYDESVRRCAADAKANNWQVISDTSYDGYMAIPRDVMHGYMALAEEAANQLPEGAVPTHALIQAGVGGLAAAFCAAFWLRWGEQRPRFVVVEPDKADCCYRSAVAGKPTTTPGDLDTVMAGLAAGEISPLAWTVLKAGADDFVTLDDEYASRAMRLLAETKPAVVAGESGAAGIACLIAAQEHPALARALGLDGSSRVMLVGSEGATDPELYFKLVGRKPQDVAR
ncbi:MAG: diaminopropionate ammonia-lyase [Alphaproteobacteria bacterium]|nr:diaminopropionate ammonia-lyase [Alphaproteobacteria bacterium]